MLPQRNVVTVLLLEAKMVQDEHLGPLTLNLQAKGSLCCQGICHNIQEITGLLLHHGDKDGAWSPGVLWGPWYPDDPCSRSLSPGWEQNVDFSVAP